MKKIAILLLIVFMSGCLKTGDDIPLKQKVELFWKARITGKYTFKYKNKTLRLYEDFLAEDLKKKVSEQKFYSLLNYKVLQFKIQNITYSKDEKDAMVTVLISIDFQGYRLDNIKIKNKWIKEKGSWRVLLKTQSNPFSDNM